MSMSICSSEKENGIADGSGDVQAESFSEECVDSRVQVELERLNAATDVINKLEIELDGARSQFRLLLSESAQHADHLAKKLGSCIEKARPYYECRMRAMQLQAQTQKAALRYERATSSHTAAKEMVYLAEEGLCQEGRCFDPAWQEMINHATMRVNEAETERILSYRDHQQTSIAYSEAERNVQQLHHALKKAITKSSLSTRRSLLQLNNLAYQHQLQLLPYFEMKAHFNQLLQHQRIKVHHLEENILKVKLNYADALHNLEEISDEIHQKRKEECGTYKSEENAANASSFELLQESYISVTSCQESSPNNSSKGRDVWQCSNYPITFPRLSLADNNDKGDSARDLIMNSKTDTQNDDLENVQAGKESPKSSIDDSLRQLSLEFDETVKLSQSAKIFDGKHSTVNMNMFRIQKDLSDSESVGSNDTAETLDDDQIECLLLDSVLSSEYDDIKDSFEAVSKD